MNEDWKFSARQHQKEMLEKGYYKHQIILQPACQLCGRVLFIRKDGILEHGDSEGACINDNKTYKMVGAVKEEGEFSELEMLDRYNSIDIEEIKE